MLNTHLLEKLRHRGGKTLARCPACAEEGRDRTGNHLTIFPSGKYACAAHAGDAEHRRRIFALVGNVSALPTDDEARRQWSQQRARQSCLTHQRHTTIRTARALRGKILSQYPWEPANVWEDSPQRIDGPPVESDPRHFLASLFPTDAILWTGETHHSGQEGKHAHHWQTCASWQSALPSTIGPMVTPCTWQPGTHSRSGENVRDAPYLVLDFDGFDGHQPDSPQQLRQHVRDSLSIIRWVRETQHLRLAAILWTGSKSLHAWFHTPAPEALTALRTIAPTLGMDAGLIGHPEHPCRLPGMIHHKTGKTSRVLWLG